VFKNKLFYLMFVLILHSIFLSAVVFSYSYPIDLGSLKYISDQNLEKSNILVIPLENINDKYLEVRLQNSFKSEAGNYEISGNRLTVKSSTGSYSIETRNTPIPVAADDLIKLENSIAFLAEIHIEVRPEDLPGQYHSQLIVSHLDLSDSLIESGIPVKFRVEPWLEMEIAHDSSKISETNFINNSLSTSYPGIIKISGNVPWQLFVTGVQNEITSNNNMKISVNSHDNSIVIREDTLNLSEKKVLIASAEMTDNCTGDKFKINYDFLINDYTNIRAGKIFLPVIFSLEPLNY